MKLFTEKNGKWKWNVPKRKVIQVQKRVGNVKTFHGAWACNPKSNFWDVLVEFHWFWWLEGMIDRSVYIIICHHVNRWWSKSHVHAVPTSSRYRRAIDHQTVELRNENYTKKYLYTHAPWLWHVTQGSFHIDISRHRRAQTERFQEEAGCARRNHTRPTSAGLTRAQKESGTCYHEYWCKPCTPEKAWKRLGYLVILYTNIPILLRCTAQICLILKCSYVLVALLAHTVKRESQPAQVRQRERSLSCNCRKADTAAKEALR